MVMQDLGGVRQLQRVSSPFHGMYLKSRPVEEHLKAGLHSQVRLPTMWTTAPAWTSRKCPSMFPHYRYPETYVNRSWEERKTAGGTCLDLRKLLSEDTRIRVFFWRTADPERVGDPRDMAHTSDVTRTLAAGARHLGPVPPKHQL